MCDKKITAMDSLKQNWLSWCVILLCIFIISYPNVTIGYFTFFIFIFLAYFIHYSSHTNNNIFTTIHRYHHENNNFFSHFSQIILELSVSSFLIPFYYLGYSYVFNIWVVLLFTFFYTTIHNINYGQLHVNDVHSEHHNNMFCNIGPDICDIIFSTKSEKNVDVENTTHYIPNVIIGTILVLLLKYACQNEDTRNNLIYIYIVFIILVYIFLISSSLFLFFNKKNQT